MATIDPCSVIGEVLGEPADLMRNPVNAGYQCPFMNSKCTKRSQRIEGPFPVCSVYRKGRQTENLIAVCPKRFMATSFLQDVVAHCWTGPKPKNLAYATEVKMKGIGMVDYVVADLNDERTIVENFVSVELQSVDITGSYEPAFTALTNNNTMAKRPTFGFNWANVRKRYISQLISKGFFHHQWSAKIVSVLQDHIFQYFVKSLGIEEIAIANADIVFLVYRFERDDETSDSDHHNLVLDRVFGTSHNSLMMRSLYSVPPPREEFCKRILDRAQL